MKRDVSLSRAFYRNYFVFYLLNTQIGHFAEIHSFSTEMHLEHKVKILGLHHILTLINIINKRFH